MEKRNLLLVPKAANKFLDSKGTKEKWSLYIMPDKRIVWTINLLPVELLGFNFNLSFYTEASHDLSAFSLRDIKPLDDEEMEKSEKVKVGKKMKIGELKFHLGLNKFGEEILVLDDCSYELKHEIIRWNKSI